MAGGPPRTKINWALILQAIGTGFTILAVVVGGLMAYSYMNGSFDSRLDNHEQRIKQLEDARRR